MSVGVGVALIIAVTIVTIIIIIAIYVLVTRKPDFGYSILNAIHEETYLNQSPPSYIDFSFIPYAFKVLGDRVLVNFKEDLGQSEGVGTFTAEIYDLTDRSLTLKNFSYTQHPGVEVVNMPQGPWYLTLTESGLTLSGHYDNVMEMLVRG